MIELENYAKLENYVKKLFGQEPQIDLHKERAAQMFGVPYDEVTPEQRRVAKAKNYYDFYGPELRDVAIKDK